MEWAWKYRGQWFVFLSISGVKHHDGAVREQTLTHTHSVLSFTSHEETARCPFFSSATHSRGRIEGVHQSDIKPVLPTRICTTTGSGVTKGSVSGCTHVSTAVFGVLFLVTVVVKSPSAGRQAKRQTNKPKKNRRLRADTHIWHETLTYRKKETQQRTDGVQRQPVKRGRG
jgi:hypothetical protein